MNGTTTTTSHPTRPPLNGHPHPRQAGQSIVDPGASDAGQAPRRLVTLASVAILCVVAFLACWLRNQTLLGAALLFAIGVSGRIPRLRIPDALALGLAAWAACTLAWTVDVNVTLSSAYLYVSACVIFVAVRHIVTTKADLVAVACAYLLGVSLRAFQLIADAMKTGTAPRADAFDLTVRYGIDGFNINFTAYSLVTGFLLTLLVIRVGDLPRKARFALYALLPVLAYAVLLNATRGAIAALVVGSAYFLVSRWLTKVCWYGALVLVPTLLILIPIQLTHGALPWLDSLFEYRSTGDLAGRLLVWPYAMQSWSESLLTGVGAGIFPLANPAGFGAHNLVLTVGNDLGLIGLLVYAALVATALVKAARRSPVNRRLAGLFLVGFLPVWMTGHWDVALGMWLLLGLTSVLSDPSVVAPATPEQGKLQRPESRGLQGIALVER
ncbi:O-antigen ligase family protein [Micromonospora purpureochromogenes]|uniref:O-antigen ligase family protein n=1 Tax=Micromonospora purpureochromogenes TaxID=47872 RepID=UPI0033D716FD